MYLIEEFADIMAAEVPMLHHGLGGQVYFNKLPENTQEDVICLTQYWADNMFPSPYDEYRINARIRGHDIDDSLAGYGLADDLWSSLHGWLRPPGWEGSIDFIEAAGPPMSIGYDENDRAEWSLNFAVHTTRDITYRSL